MRAFSASCFGSSTLSFASRARFFSSRAFFAMPSLSSVSLRLGVHVLLVQVERRAPAAMATFLPPAKISCRPCSSYHLVSVAVMCIFSMMLRQPMPVL